MTTVRIALALLLAGLGARGANAAGGTVKGTVTRAGAEALANAVVMLDGPEEPAPAGAPHAVVHQHRSILTPRVIAVPVGTTVDFPNEDSTLHNVFSTSPAKGFDLGMYGEGETKSVTFERPGVVDVRCNVHPAMQAFVVVHTNRWAAVTDAHGAYTIAGVSVGPHQARVWHESLPERTVPVVVHDGQVETLDVSLQPPR